MSNMQTIIENSVVQLKDLAIRDALHSSDVQTVIRRTVDIEWKEFDYDKPPSFKGLCWLNVLRQNDDFSDNDQATADQLLEANHFVTLGFIDFHEECTYDGTISYRPDFYCPAFGKMYDAISCNDFVTHYAFVMPPKPVAK